METTNIYWDIIKIILMIVGGCTIILVIWATISLYLDERKEREEQVKENKNDICSLSRRLNECVNISSNCIITNDQRDREIGELKKQVNALLSKEKKCK